MAKPKGLRTGSSKVVEKKNKAYLVMLALPAVIVTVIAGYGLSKFFSKSDSKTEDLTLYQLKETRPPLSPALFQGKIARAYQVALEIPKVLDQLYCYCKCEENFGHKSLLSCYVDQHGAN